MYISNSMRFPNKFNNLNKYNLYIIKYLVRLLMDRTKNQSHKIDMTPQDKLYCEFCECYHSKANKSLHYKTQKHIKAKFYKESLTNLAKSLQPKRGTIC